MDHSGEQLDRELAREQDYADLLYARVDELIDHVDRNLTEAQASQYASTHQNRSERDAFVALYEDRLSLLRSVSNAVVFGRLDMDDGARRYIGRIGLFTTEREQLLVDWRAPAAAAFYQATSADRQQVRLRRHLLSQGRVITGLEDDVLDQSLLRTDQPVILHGEGALLAAVSAQRSGRMGDIVATIQAEQDRIIRSEHRGMLVVQGGPGTGKTAVALHRAAYLLYTHRRRLEHTGVLIVAPTRGFLRYIERVLPSLGESGVVMTTPGELMPGIEATVHDCDEVAKLKGHPAMAELLARAVKQRQCVPVADQHFRVNGTEVVLRCADVAAARKEARASHRPHNAARVVFVRAALERLTDAYMHSRKQQGLPVMPEDRMDAMSDLRDDPHVRRALNLAWLPYTPEQFVRILFAHPERLASAAPRSLQDRVHLLHRAKDSAWTVEDVPLLDEVAELLGDDDGELERAGASAGPSESGDLAFAQGVLENIGTSGIVRAEDLAAQVGRVRDGRTLAERAVSDRTWTYGHVVVDEAQEHSPMMWRALMRRCPTKSFTVVGDVAQTSSASGTRSWHAALEPFVGDRLQVHELTVNYRTPARIIDHAQAMAREHELPVTEVTSVREGTVDPVLTQVSAARIPTAVVEAVDAQLSTHGGRVAVISSPQRVPGLGRALTEEHSLPAVATGSSAVDAPVAVMSPMDAKGLEFDGVVIVEPGEIVDAHDGGAGDLYVAMTRSTQRLDIVHALPLPAGI